MSRVTRKGPTLEPHRVFHPGTKGYVHMQYDPVGSTSIDIGVKVRNPVEVGPWPGSNRYYVGSIPTALFHQIETWIPELREQLLGQLEYDAELGINTLFRPKPYPTKHDYRQLGAVWVDCDCEDLDYFEAVEKVYALQAREIVPPISVIANTGRGIHVYWLLRGGEDDPELPPRGYARNCEMLVRLNREIVRRVKKTFSELEADVNAVWVTTHQRIAGSINTKTGAEVSYTVNVDDKGNPPRYTLGQLLEHFELEARPTEYAKTKASGRTKQPQKKSGWITRHAEPLAELQLLRGYRESLRGFGQGTRRHVCYYMATLMRACGYPRSEIEREVLAVATRCDPPLPRDEAVTSFRSAMARKGDPPANVTIAETLGVTVELAELLGLKKIRPDFQAKPTTRTGKETPNRESRHTFLRQLAETHGNPLPFSYDDLLAQLADAGMTPARGTVYNDVKLLGLRVARTRRRRDATPPPTLVN